jgi:hypothetical protein
MGWLYAKSHTSRRWSFSLLAVLLCVFAIHIWLLQQTWHSDLGLPEPTESNVVQGQIVMQRLARAVNTPPPAPTPTPTPPPQATPPESIEESPASITAPPEPDNLSEPDSEPLSETQELIELTTEEADEPEPQLVNTEHLEAVSTFWRYRVTAESKGRNFFANATLQWKLDQNHYSAQAVVSALLLGQRSQTSEGSITPHGLSPERFIDASRRTREITFDWDQRVAQREEQVIATSLPDGTQDRLSAIVQLTVQIMNSPVQPSLQQEWTIPVVGFSGQEEWTFVYLGQALQDLPAGKFITWHLQRKPRPDDRRGTTIDLWLAPAQYFVPVRIRYTESNGDFVDQELIAL